jgi:nucleotide-binding universal stress UspA family protein
MDSPKRTYLVVIDDSGEARCALRFAARRAARTGGSLEVLAVTQAQEFVQWGGVQAALEEEQQLRIEARVAEALGELPGAEEVRPQAILIQAGEPVALVRDLVAARQDIVALVLGAAPSGDPGVLVAAFTGSDSGKLPCPVMLIPGGLSDERLKALS